VSAGSTTPRRCLDVVIASHDSSIDGGAERSLYVVAVALNETGRVNPLVTVPREGSLATALRARSIRTFVLPTPLWTPFNPDVLRSSLPLGGLARRGRRALAIARLTHPWVQWLRTAHPDVVVTNTATIPTPALASAALGVPHVWWLKEFVTKDHGLSYVLGEPLSQRVIGWLSKFVVANSRAVQEHFSPPIPRDKMRMIHSGFPAFDPSPNRIDLPILRVLLLGRQTPAKGGKLALEAVSILEPEPTRVELRLVGAIRPTYRNELIALARELGIVDRVEILDHTTTPENQISWANVVLMCSDAEAFGRVTVEALKSGRPVIGTRSGGTPELIADGENGFLFEPGNAQELASAVRRIASEPGLLARMSENARTGTRDRFTLEGYVEEFVAILSAAASR
jgi:glycosyltransferase involved in cell wall biosynthesis